MWAHRKSSLIVQTSSIQHAPDGELLGTVTFDSFAAVLIFGLRSRKRRKPPTGGNENRAILFL
jgi:hypothetical protein